MVKEVSYCGLKTEIVRFHICFRHEQVQGFLSKITSLSGSSLVEVARVGSSSVVRERVCDRDSLGS